MAVVDYVSLAGRYNVAESKGWGTLLSPEME